MSTEAGGTVALAANWLEPVAYNAMSNANASVTSSTVTITNGSYIGDPGLNWSNWWVWPAPIYQPYYVPLTTYVTTREKIHLKSSEVERLRMAAKRDAKLKAVLQKFTPFIEVELEF